MANEREFDSTVQPDWREYLTESLKLGASPIKVYKRPPLVLPCSERNAYLAMAALGVVGVIILRHAWSNPNMNTIGGVIVFFAVIAAISEYNERKAARRMTPPEPASSASRRAERVRLRHRQRSTK